jgi:LPXTG-motif cell wall-anchored protein
VFVPDEAVTDAGDYVVQYSAQAVDGHLVIGSFEFTVGGPAAGTSNSAIGVIGTALIVVGLAAGLFWWFRKRNARGQTPPVTT